MQRRGKGVNASDVLHDRDYRTRAVRPLVRPLSRTFTQDASTEGQRIVAAAMGGQSGARMADVRQELARICVLSQLDECAEHERYRNGQGSALLVNGESMRLWVSKHLHPTLQ